MTHFPQNTDALLSTAQSEALYQKLIEQLNKDFRLANQAIDLHDGVAPVELKNSLLDKVYDLLLNKFSEYLNLLYIVDVSEEDIRKLNLSDLVDLAEAVTFLILKREWQKVWYRSKFQQ
ncbi:MAG TPA: hypothetical protein VLZ11_08465 [Flavobacterium sp.]|nr:hypothetical protein [Flavobacterium sp.]